MRLAVLGDPVSHSLSPAIHTAALSAAGIAGDYTARRVDADGMRRAVAEIRDGDLFGANVTMPHKGLAAELADRLEPRAMRARSVNTLWSEERSVLGDSTDIDGVITAWRWAGLPENAPVLILGSGGAGSRRHPGPRGPRPDRRCAKTRPGPGSLGGAGRRRPGLGRWTFPGRARSWSTPPPLGCKGSRSPRR